MKKVYCPICKKEVLFNVESRIAFCNDYDVPFKYNEKYAICKECGEELYIDELEIDNQKSFKDAYQKANEIISVDEIKLILEKYNVGVRVLPHILGLGELTITRYLNGYIPSKKISLLLKDILNSSELYKEYLERNKNQISKNAYAKTSNKLNSILGVCAFDEKLEKYADYIIAHNEETTNLVLNKLLYYCEVFNRLIKKEKLFQTACGVWEHGPVYGQIYYENKSYGDNPICKKEIENINVNEKEIVDQVIKKFGMYSGKVLSFFTHNDGPWKKAYDNGVKFIDDSSMNEYVNKMALKYGDNINSIDLYCNDMLLKYKDKYAI